MIKPKPSRTERPLHVWVSKELLEELDRRRRELGYTRKELVALVLTEFLQRPTK